VLSLLLEKDPLQRITYEELIAHPYWQDKGFEYELTGMKAYKIPHQPQFDAYLKNRGIDPQHYMAHKHSTLGA
jgi:hypothetical protein